MFSLIANLKKKNKSFHKKKLNKKINLYIEKVSGVISQKRVINFLHSGHLGDLINSLPVIKEIAKKSECNLYINLEKKINNTSIDSLHPSKGYFLNSGSYEKILPLLKKQNYLTKVKIFKDELIDIDLDYFRELPINFNIDSIRWYFHLTGVNPDLKDPYIQNIDEDIKYKNCIIFMRSMRRQNEHISFRFLEKYQNLLFIGLHNEYLDLKKQIKNLEFHECKNFLEMAQIIQSSKLFIGNLSFGYTIAEGLKKPRLLESYLDFPLVYPNGKSGYEFYFQTHFEKYVKNFMNN
jgi:hypothetical protein